MERSYYNADTLRAELDAFETKYGVSSAEHYQMRYNLTALEIPELSHFDSHVWADVYREWLKLEATRP